MVLSLLALVIQGVNLWLALRAYRREAAKAAKAREDLRKAREDLRKEREDFRKEREALRKGEEALAREMALKKGEKAL